MLAHLKRNLFFVIVIRYEQKYLFVQRRFLLSHANNLRRLFVVFTCLVCLEQLVSHLHQEKEQVPLGAARSTTLLTRHAEPAKLILLWNEYQMIGKKIYENIFRRITDGHCPISNCRL